jgi:hypothetical protein
LQEIVVRPRFELPPGVVLALRVSTPHTATAVREVQRPLKEAPPHAGLSRDERAAVARALMCERSAKAASAGGSQRRRNGHDGLDA